MFKEDAKKKIDKCKHFFLITWEEDGNVNEFAAGAERDKLVSALFNAAIYYSMAVDKEELPNKAPQMNKRRNLN